MSTYADKHGQWWVAIEVGYSRNGARKRIRRQATGQKAAATLERKLLRERDAGQLAVSRSPTVKAWCEDWLARQAHRVRPKTWSGYQTTVRYTIAAIGHRKLDSLTAADVRAVGKAVRDTGATSTVVRDHQTRLRKILKDAAAEHHLSAGVLMVELAGRAPTDRTAIPIEQAQRILRAAADRADGSRWMAALIQGMRQGECLGLTWPCVDLDARLMDVSWQLQPVRYRHGCTEPCGHKHGGHCPQRQYQVPDDYDYRPLHGAMCLTRPKTARGQRIIPLVPWMATAVQRWQAVAPASPHGLVWPATDGRPRLARDDDAEWKQLQGIAKAKHPAGRTWAVHEARHTAATLLMVAGVPESVRIAILGHSQAAVTRQYEHADQTQALKALESVAGQLGWVG